ncbi:hypothetical protein ACV35Z_33545, partial [Pseudomonas aeruginosa]
PHVVENNNEVETTVIGIRQNVTENNERILEVGSVQLNTTVEINSRAHEVNMKEPPDKSPMQNPPCTSVPNDRNSPAKASSPLHAKVTATNTDPYS